MANPINVAISGLSLSSFSITLTGRTTKTDDLVASYIKLFKLSGTSFVAADFILATDPAPTATTAKILGGTTGETPFLDTDILLLQIDDGSQVSDRIALDFKQTITSTSNSNDYDYMMPSTTGGYKMSLLSINDEAVASVESTEFPLRDAQQSTIAQPKYKTYLTPVIGQVVKVNVGFENVGDVGSADYQVSFSADLQ